MRSIESTAIRLIGSWRDSEGTPEQLLPCTMMFGFGDDMHDDRAESGLEISHTKTRSHHGCGIVLSTTDHDHRPLQLQGCGRGKHTLELHVSTTTRYDGPEGYKEGEWILRRENKPRLKLLSPCITRAPGKLLKEMEQHGKTPSSTYLWIRDTQNLHLVLQDCYLYITILYCGLVRILHSFAQGFTSWSGMNLALSGIGFLLLLKT